MTHRQPVDASSVTISANGVGCGGGAVVENTFRINLSISQSDGCGLCCGLFGSWWTITMRHARQVKASMKTSRGLACSSIAMCISGGKSIKLNDAIAKLSFNDLLIYGSRRVQFRHDFNQTEFHQNREKHAFLEPRPHALHSLQPLHTHKNPAQWKPSITSSYGRSSEDDVYDLKGS